MKGLIILIVVGGLALVGVYYFGGFATLDPAAQGEQFHNAVQTGMTWEQVADLKEPRKFYVMDPEAMGGHGPAQDFSRDYVRSVVASGVPGGFGFDYVFTGDHAWSVIFDSTGKVVLIEKLRTTKDLFTLPS